MHSYPVARRGEGPCDRTADTARRARDQDSAPLGLGHQAAVEAAQNAGMTGLGLG